MSCENIFCQEVPLMLCFNFIPCVELDILGRGGARWVSLQKFQSLTLKTPWLLWYIYNNITTSSTLNNPGNMSDVYEYIGLFTSYLQGTSRPFQHLFSLCPITKIERRKRAIEPFSAALLPFSLIGQLT